MALDRSGSFKIGTRNSPLAMVQAETVKAALEKAHPPFDIEIISIRSNADWNKAGGEVPLSEEAGGKGMFATEIEAMIAAGKVHCGVHSLKDMATDLPNGLALNHVLPRADVRDAFISAKAGRIEDLPKGSTVGTCSPRRAAMALHIRPDLKIVPFRGNVGTRIEKVKNEQVDATFLAMAGLERLGIKDDIIHPMAIEDFLPACGQGAICIEIRKEDGKTQQILDALHCNETYLCVAAEREVLRVLDGSCQTPIAAYATYDQGVVTLTAQVLSLDGQSLYQEELDSSYQSFFDPIELGRTVGEQLKEKVPDQILTV
jgi:hydroxymethylbilane synthase